MADVKRPLPKLADPDTGPFWEATKKHELRYQTCDACSGIVFFPRSHCTHCLGQKLSWRISKGDGTIYTYSVVRKNYHPYFAKRAPYAVAWIDLDEGFRMMSNIVGVEDPIREIKVGQRVRVEWEDQEELSLPMFRPI